MERSEFNHGSHESDERGKLVTITTHEPNEIILALANPAHPPQEAELYYSDTSDYQASTAPQYLKSVYIGMEHSGPAKHARLNEPHSALVFTLELTTSDHDIDVLCAVQHAFLLESRDYSKVEQGELTSGDTLHLAHHSPADNERTSELIITVSGGKIFCKSICAAEDEHSYAPREFDASDYTRLLGDHTMAIERVVNSTAAVFQDTTPLEPILIALDQSSARHFERPRFSDTPDENDGHASLFSPSKPALERAYAPKPHHMDTIGGLTGAKAHLRRLVLILEHPETAKEYGVSANHFILHGPAGTGKTSLVHAFAEEVGAKLITANNTDFAAKWIGDSAKGVGTLFDRAMQHSDKHATVLFFDEFDSIARSSTRTHDEYLKVINEFKTQIDTVTRRNESGQHAPLIIAAATNAPIDELDPALLRAGRIEPIATPLPTEHERSDIWTILLFDSPKIAGLDERSGTFLQASAEHAMPDPIELAKATDGLTGADFRAILKAARASSFFHAVTQQEKLPITHDTLMKAARIYRQEHGR